MRKLVAGLAIIIGLGLGATLAPSLGWAQSVQNAVRPVAQLFTSNAASGQDGFRCVTNGCRIHLGSGTNDYIQSNGQTVESPGMHITGTLNLGTSIDADATGLYLRGRDADGVGAVGVRLVSLTSLTTDGALITGFYSSTSTLRAGVTKDGNLQLGIGNAATPTCDAAHRGIIQYIGGGAGVKDRVEVCGKDAANAYAWRVLY